MAVTAQGVREAAATIAGAIEDSLRPLARPCRTPPAPRSSSSSRTCSSRPRSRNAARCNKLAGLSAAERAAGVLAVSAGNHAQAVAYHAQRLGIRAMIVMPRFTPHVKVERTREHGAEVILAGDTFDEAKTAALEHARKHRLSVVHPYDDEHVICGQGTVALEMLAAVPGLEVLVVPVGGGGLICRHGGGRERREARHRDLRRRERELSVDVLCAARRTRPSPTAPSPRASPSKEPGTLTLPIVRRSGRRRTAGDEGDIEHAIVLLLEIEKTVVEGAGAAGLAALLRIRRGSAAGASGSCSPAATSIR